MRDLTLQPAPSRRSGWRRIVRLTFYLALTLLLFWGGAIALEWNTGWRVWPWSPYSRCGNSEPAVLPTTMRLGLYEEFPDAGRLAPLKQVDFPVSLAIAAQSRTQFTDLRLEILRNYPQVRELYFWPLLEPNEGYYPGTWSQHSALRRVAEESEGLPVLWDLEVPPQIEQMQFRDWRANRAFLDTWLENRKAPVHLWRTHAELGLDSSLLTMGGMHYDPLNYQRLSLHLDLYATGEGLPEALMTRILRCGVERYGDRFIPSFGMLNDGLGPQEVFVPADTLRRDLILAREAGVAEVWLFGVNGLNQEYLSVVRETLPLPPLPGDSEHID